MLGGWASPCVFMEERWLLPEIKGSGGRKPTWTIWADNTPTPYAAVLFS